MQGLKVCTAVPAPDNSFLKVCFYLRVYIYDFVSICACVYKYLRRPDTPDSLEHL